MEAPSHTWRVDSAGGLKTTRAFTVPPESIGSRKACIKARRKIVEEISALQRVLYADDRYSLLCVFQAMDAAGKDSTIRKVFTGVNPAGFQVSSFKKPSSLELDHDFLWRSAIRLPERGRIGVFNRSYYEEALVVRVHPEFLGAQRLPQGDPSSEAFWQQRYASIRDHEAHLSRNGTVVLKFFLNVSRDEQKRRFLSRLNEPEKYWKFSDRDIVERQYWPHYMAAYEEAINATATDDAPWFAIPADNKPWMRLQVATIIRDTLAALPISYPKVSDKQRATFADARAQLEQE
ncbi:polyphosphate kinase 2 family protein [Gammaproteobacteria bacterium]|nr:polyphosphate kinase 2 family protein [Gammaproteobacteria bacterium]